MVNQFALQAEVTGIGALGWVTIGDLNLPKNIFNPEIGWVVYATFLELSCVRRVTCPELDW